MKKLIWILLISMPIFGCELYGDGIAEPQFYNDRYYVVNESNETDGSIRIQCYEYFGDEKIMVSDRTITITNMKPNQVLYVTPGSVLYYEVQLILKAKNGAEIYKRIIINPR